MAETALKFGPEWLRALSHGPKNDSLPTSSSSPDPEPPKYKLADYRYGREEMLALFPKDPKMPESLTEFSHLVKEKSQIPLALMPMTDEEQRILATSVNSELSRGVSGKGGATGPGISISRTGRGGSVDRGRGRGRGSYFVKGLSFEDGDDGPPGGFPRPRPMERSQSANEKDQRWDDRDRRFDRPYSGRNFDDSGSIAKPEGPRAPVDNWRKTEKPEDDSGWRTTAVVRNDKQGTRGSWRNHIEKDRNHEEFEKPLLRNHEPVLNGPSKTSHPKNQRHSNHFWDEDTSGKLPEWIMDKPSDADIVGSFDSSGAFLETKIKEDNADEIYASDEEEENIIEESPAEHKQHDRRESPIKRPVPNNTDIPETVTQSWTKPSPEASAMPLDPHPPRKDSGKKYSSSQKNDKLTNSVIISNIPVQTAVTHPSDAVMSNVPDQSGVKKELTNNQHQHKTRAQPPQVIEVPAHVEEDAFAHHKKATENMVAQWTEEEEHRIRSQSVDKITVLPTHHEDAYKWYYRDPQGEVQGPFGSSEMLEWYQSGYFTLGLMIRRSCDEIFSQLGQLIKTWGQVPFLPMVPAPPIRVPAPIMTTVPPTPMTPTTVPSSQPLTDPSHSSKSEEQLRVLQQQLMQQQIMQQQLLIRQAQLQQLLTQLKTQDNFANLNPKQQYEVLVRQFVSQQPHSRHGPMGDQISILEQMPNLAMPLLGLPMTPLIKNDLSLWGLSPPAAGPWPVGFTNPQSPTGSIWDTDQSTLSNEAKMHEEQIRIADEERKKVEELRKLEEEKKREEDRRNREEMERKLEEERLRQEYLKKEEERRLLEELKRQQEEKRRQEELKRIEEQKRKEEEERRMEEQRQQEKMRLQAELEEKQRQEALRKKEEQCRLEEQKKLEEQKRIAEQMRLEEQKKLEECRRLQEIAKHEEMQRQNILQKEREQQRLQELEKQRELLNQEELEAKELRAQQERMWEFEKQKDVETIQKLKTQGPVWGAQNPTFQNSELSLADIQRLQEEKEKEEKEERLRQQQMVQQFAKHTQQIKNGPSWAKKSEVFGPTVMSLAEIQHEEAIKLAHQQKTQKPKPVVSVATPLTSGNPWGNSSHLISKVSAAPIWDYSEVSTSGFWDDVVNSTSVRKSSPKTNESAFPALNNLVKPANASSNKSKNAKTKKDEENVIKIFESHRKATDEFTQWCTDALSNLPSSLDVPTFVAFLKDIESPYEVYDYVRSYLGESKDAREFGKQFLERRSKFRNQAKLTPAEENLWGPAPAITPSVNKSIAQPTNECEGHLGSKGKTKKKKNKMQKVDSSILGFTVQSNPDRLNVGEIDRVDGM